MQLTTPIEPAMAVSTAINTLSNLLQSTFLDIYFSCFRLHIMSFSLSSRVIWHAESADFRRAHLLRSCLPPQWVSLLSAT